MSWFRPSPDPLYQVPCRDIKNIAGRTIEEVLTPYTPKVWKIGFISFGYNKYALMDHLFPYLCSYATCMMSNIQIHWLYFSLIFTFKRMTFGTYDLAGFTFVYEPTQFVFIPSITNSDGRMVMDFLWFSLHYPRLPQFLAAFLTAAYYLLLVVTLIRVYDHLSSSSIAFLRDVTDHRFNHIDMVSNALFLAFIGNATGHISNVNFHNRGFKSKISNRDDRSPGGFGIRIRPNVPRVISLQWAKGQQPIAEDKTHASGSGSLLLTGTSWFQNLEGRRLSIHLSGKSPVTQSADYLNTQYPKPHVS